MRRDYSGSSDSLRSSPIIATACWPGCIWFLFFSSWREKASSTMLPTPILHCSRWARSALTGSTQNVAAHHGRDCLLHGALRCGAYIIAMLVPVASSGPVRNFALDKAPTCPKRSDGKNWCTRSHRFAIPYLGSAGSSRHHRRQLRRAEIVERFLACPLSVG
jgi:hypothetical protein